MTGRKSNSRAIAAGIIAEWIETGDFPDRLMSDIVDDRAFVMEMVYGAVRRKRTLEWIIKQFVPRKQRFYETACLMVGIYQLFFMDNVAEHAAINETVEAVKSGPCRPSTAGFVNGVLRNFQRRREEIRQSFETRPLGIRESHPEILVRRWKKQFGADRAEALCKWNNTRPDTIIVPNTLKTTMTSLAGQLKSAGICTEPHPYMPDSCLVLPHGVNVTDVPGYTEGLFSVQDPSTMNAVKLLDPQPGETVLDACAAPGGKTMLIIQHMQDKGQIISMDMYLDRLKILRENAKRMQVSSIRITQASLLRENDMCRICRDKQLDRILLDVPCTNTGVLRRRPDARWRFEEKRLKELAILQESMLNSAARYLRPGGTLVYSTCSLEEEEGALLIEAWLKKNKDFRIVNQLTTWPPDTLTDGAFAALLVKDK